MDPHDQAWLIRFSGDPLAKRRENATLISVDGHSVLRLSAPNLAGSLTRGPSRSPDASSFEADARMAGAGLQMYHAMQSLLAMALKAGVADSDPAVTAARQALDTAKPAMFDVLHKNGIVFIGTRDECYSHVVRASGQSFEMASQGDYQVRPVGAPMADYPGHLPEPAEPRSLTMGR